MVKNYYGVLTKTSRGYTLFTHKSEVNLSDELKYFWQLDRPIHRIIESESRRLLDECKCEIYYDKDNNKKYKFHINGINIEDIFENSIGRQLDIALNFESGDIEHGSKYIHKS